MKKINNYWIDKNNNRWDASNHTKKQAQAESKSLVNCSDCRKKRNKEQWPC